MRTSVYFVGNRIVLESTSTVQRLRHLLPPFREPRARVVVTGQEYLLGLRGFLVIQCFLWVFLQTFAPTAVKDAANVDGPTYQQLLRKTLSVLFWNGNLLYSSFIFLSARTLCIPFFKAPKKSVVASAVVRRGLRLWFPVAVSLALVTTVFSQLGLDYIEDFQAVTGNVSFERPYFLSNAVIYFNSVFNLFWVSRDFATQSGSVAFPSQTLWIVNVVYNQSFTVFMVMVAVPFTRPAWRLQMGAVFIATAWWVQSWAWYSVTGMLIADAVMHMDFLARAAQGIKIWRDWRLPAWVPAGAVLLAGLVMQYVWVAARPELTNSELLAHTSLYTADALNYKVKSNEPQARDDNYLFIVGFFLLLEMFEPLQAAFANRVFVYLGKRSLSKCTLLSLHCFSRPPSPAVSALLLIRVPKLTQPTQ